MKERIRSRVLVVVTAVLWLVGPTQNVFGLSDALTLIGADQVSAQYPDLDGVDDRTGRTQRIAVLDSGIQFDHPAFAGRVVDGINFAADKPWGSVDPRDYTDRHGHGTFVAGVIGSADPWLSGLAPEIELVSVRVLNASGSGGMNSIIEGLRWVNDNAERLNITAVNMSLGTSDVFADERDLPPLNQFELLSTQLDTLLANDIVTVVASGNNGSATGLSVPAIFDSVVSVGATTKQDTIANYSNRNAALELLAPGSGIMSLWKDSATSIGSGTSFAAPFVAAASTLVRELYDQKTAKQFAGVPFQELFVDLLQATAEPIYDNRSGRTFGRLDLGDAIATFADQLGFASLSSQVMTIFQPPQPMIALDRAINTPAPSALMAGAILLSLMSVAHPRRGAQRPACG